MLLLVWFQMLHRAAALLGTSPALGTAVCCWATSGVPGGNTADSNEKSSIPNHPGHWKNTWTKTPREREVLRICLFLCICTQMIANSFTNQISTCQISASKLFSSHLHALCRFLFFSCKTLYLHENMLQVKHILHISHSTGFHTFTANSKPGKPSNGLKTVPLTAQQMGHRAQTSTRCRTPPADGTHIENTLTIAMKRRPQWLHQQTKEGKNLLKPQALDTPR